MYSSPPTHSLTVRLPATATVPTAFDALAERCGAGLFHRLWTDAVPAPADSPLAARRVRAEQSRPAGPAPRAVLLGYPDGLGDLVLVAHRSVLDATSLRLIADVLSGVRAATEVSFEDVAAPVPDAEAGTRWHPDWAAGAGEVGVVDVELGENTDLAVLTVAAALVLGRYEDLDAPAIGVLAGRPDRPSGALGAFILRTLFAPDLGRPTADLLSDPGRMRWNADERVRVGIVADGLADDGYLACQTPPFPLTLEPRHGVLRVHHTLDAASTRAFGRHLARACVQLRAGAQTAAVDLLDETERRVVLAAGRPATAPDRQPERIEAVFAARAAERPDSIAVTCERESLTYRELDERTDRFAAALVSMGVRPGERVGVCVERSANLVVTMLAVLKADATYVPIDTAYPADRLEYIVRHAELRVVVTGLDEFPGDVMAVRPEQLAAFAGASASAPNGGPNAAAYVIFTSGSTGRPKGVVVPHRNVVSLVAATRDDFGLGCDDVWSLFHSAAFDFSVWEIWGALLTGARLAVVPYWVSRSPEEFHALLAAERVSVLNQTPSAFTQLMAADRGRQPLTVRLVIFGGEPLDTRALLPWLDRYPGSRCRLVNMFGITETTVHVTAQTITRRHALTGSRSVGSALPGWRVYVLDEHGRPVPYGVAGEIYVGGEGVAAGYLGNPELTAERFLTDPFAGGRMYRSGDRGRLLRGGVLEHLGRLDTQVKVRGFRIELDEIRNVLLDDPAVASAAVVLHGDPRRDAAGVRIDAYVVLSAAVDTAQVRRRAARVLPDYMLPATVTALTALPLNTNGKLDIHGLPDPATAAQVVAPAARETGDDLSEALTEVWESVLGVRVGPDVDFFELGGNSLAAVRLSAAMRERGMPPVGLRELYRNPTVRRLAAVFGAADR